MNSSILRTAPVPDVLDQPAPDPSPAVPASPSADGVPVPAIDSETLFRGHREVLILHGDQTYRLRLTRSGKLILQK